MGCENSRNDDTDLVEFSLSRCTVLTEQRQLYDEVEEMLDESIAGATMTEAGEVSQAVSRKLRVWEANRKHGIDADPNQFDPGRAPKLAAHEEQKVRECITTQLVASIENVSFGIHKVMRNGDAVLVVDGSNSPQSNPPTPNSRMDSLNPPTPNSGSGLNPRNLMRDSNTFEEQYHHAAGHPGVIGGGHQGGRRTTQESRSTIRSSVPSSRGSNRQESPTLKLAARNAKRDADVNLLKENVVFVEAVLSLCYKQLNGRNYGDVNTHQNREAVGGDSNMLGAGDGQPVVNIALWPPVHLTTDYRPGGLAMDFIIPDDDDGGGGGVTVDHANIMYNYSPSSCGAASEANSGTRDEASPGGGQGCGALTSAINGGDGGVMDSLETQSSDSNHGLTPGVVPTHRGFNCTTLHRPPHPTVDHSRSIGYENITPPPPPAAGVPSLSPQRRPQSPKALLHSSRLRESLQQACYTGDSSDSEESSEYNSSALSHVNIEQWQRICRMNTTEGFSIGAPPPAPAFASQGKTMQPSLAPAGGEGGALPTASKKAGGLSVQGGRKNSDSFGGSRSLLQPNQSTGSPFLFPTAGASSSSFSVANSLSLISTGCTSSSSTLIQAPPSVTLITSLNGGTPFVVNPEFEIYAVLRPQGYGVTCAREVKKKGEGYYTAYGALLFAWFRKHILSHVAVGTSFVPTHQYSSAGGIESVVASFSRSSVCPPSSSRSRLPIIIMQRSTTSLIDSTTSSELVNQSKSSLGDSPQTAEGEVGTSRGVGSSHSSCLSASKYQQQQHTAPLTAPCPSPSTGVWTTSSCVNPSIHGAQQHKHSLFSHFILGFCVPAEILVSIKAAASGKLTS